MGLFDFFSRRANGNDPPGLVPRCDHYTFAHVVLRDAAFANPTHCMTSLASSDAGQYVAELWIELSSTCEQQQKPVEITPDDILIHKLRVGPFPCTLLEMPSPQFANEVFFVAIVLTVDMTNQSQNLSADSIRYLTLENGEPHDEEVHTVFGEWTADGSHISHGSGPYPELGEFVSRITDLIAQRNLT
ncbi:MAG: hypothetical protein O3B13_25455 [Planctomycetota bacterium]|nr:hypothetical protein [Planctomycetota bacterium]